MGGKKMKDYSILDWFAVILVIVGAINWGLIGFFHYDLVSTIFGSATVVTRIVYGLVGLAGLYMIYHIATCSKK